MEKQLSTEVYTEKDKALQDFKNAYRFYSENIAEQKEDFEYYLGKQWSDEKMAESVNAGYGKLTQVNNIRPYIHLLEGYQRQNRNDILAYPEGDEDSLQAEGVTRLVKNVLKQSKSKYKVSEMFLYGVVSGESYLRPYMDYDRDLIHGELKLKPLTGLKVFPDPNSEEYDLSDARYINIFTQKLSREDVKSLFPEFNIDKINQGQIHITDLQEDKTEPFTKYYYKNGQPTNTDAQYPDDMYCYDMLEYYYKKHRTKYFLVNLENGGIIEGYEKDLLELKQKETDQFEIKTKLIAKRESMVWRRVIIGDTEVENKESEFSEYYSDYPIIPFRSYFCPVEILDRGKYQVQGVVRPMKEPQKEKNVARTHALRHLYSSTNSGWMAEEKSFVDKNLVAKFGSKPGIIIETKKGITYKPERLQPMTLSTAFEYLSTQGSDDLKAASGINADLLAMQGGTDSGRAIILRQQQGLVMIQGLLDNLSQTNSHLGKFIISVLPMLYTEERASRVLGEAFFDENFGQDIQEPDPTTGQPMVVGREVNQEAVTAFLGAILNDKELIKYNISVGEGMHSQTVKHNNFLQLNELAERGYPIPPDVMIDETMLSSGTKEKIKQSIQQTQTEGGK